MNNDNVTIPRSEYNDLLECRTLFRLLVRAASSSGYIPSDFIKAAKEFDEKKEEEVIF